jgi:hypothetical protein
VSKRLLTLLMMAVALTSTPTPPGQYSDVVANWHMDESTGAVTMEDSAALGGANNGVISDTVVTGAPGLVGGGAYRFDGVRSHVTVPHNASLNPGSADITLTATVLIEKGRILDDSYDIVRKGFSTTGGGAWKMEVQRADVRRGKLNCVFRGITSNGEPAGVERLADVDIADGKKHQLQCLKTSDAVTAVVDGEVFTTTIVIDSIANDQPVILGSRTAGDDVLKGVLDEVSISIG